MLRESLIRGRRHSIQFRTKMKLEINLAMALILKGYKKGVDAGGRKAIKDALSILSPEFSYTYASGRFSDAAASALLIGLASELLCDEQASQWFAQSVSTAARCSQLETLWRAHHNLATSLFKKGSEMRKETANHARAALSILLDSLSSYAAPESSSRYSLVRIPLAQSVAYLIVNDDPLGPELLTRFPSLRRCFANPLKGKLRPDRGGFSHYEWLRIGEYDYVLY